MSAEYSMGREDTKNGNPRRESEPMAERFLSTISPA